MLPADVHLPPVQRRIFDLLSDGFLHYPEELKRCLSDDLAEGKGAMYVGVSALRHLIRPYGYDVICRESMYALVRLIGR